MIKECQDIIDFTTKHMLMLQLKASAEMAFEDAGISYVDSSHKSKSSAPDPVEVEIEVQLSELPIQYGSNSMKRTSLRIEGAAATTTAPAGAVGGAAAAVGTTTLTEAFST